MKATSLGQKTRPATSTLFLVPARADRIAEGRLLAAPRVGETERDHALARRGAHPDVLELCPTAGKERVGIDAVREVVRSCQFAPAQGDRKVCLIPYAEALTVEAANALLKTLEEPPREVAFILLAGHTTDLLPTIVSRSRIVRLRAERPDELVRRLTEKGYEENDARWLISVADREAEIDRFLDERIDLPAIRDASKALAESLSMLELVTACIEGESILRRAALARLLDLAARRSPDLLTDGVRCLASQSREVLFALLGDLLLASFDLVRNVEREAGGDGTQRVARLACRAIEAAYRALSVYSPPEAVLVTLFLSIGGVSDGS
jgi:hypothetical protein